MAAGVATTPNVSTFALGGSGMQSPKPRRSAHASAVGSPALTTSERVRKSSLRVLMVNDVYSHRPVEGTGGWAELKTMLDEFRSKSPAAHTIFVLPGDFLGGSTLAESFRGANVIEVLAYLGTDYVCLGNHEFDFGDKAVVDFMKASPFPWLASNVRQASRGGQLIEGGTDVTTFAIPVTSCSLNGQAQPVEGETLRVGLFGVCTAATPSLSHPSPDIVFESPETVALDAVARLRDAQCHLVLGLTHLRTAEDCALARAVSGVAALFGGHDHTAFASFENESLVFKCGMNAQLLGVADMEIVVVDTIDPDGGRVLRSSTQVHHSFAMVQNRGWQPDPGCAAILERWERKLQEQIAAGGGAEVLMTLSSQVEWDSRSDVVRRREAIFASVIADALAWAGHADAGVINGGFIRGNKRYGRSTGLTAGDVRFELPFPKALQVITIAGRSFRAAMEQMLALAPAATGAFPHLSSTLRMRYDSSAPVGTRVRELYLDGVPMDDDDVFTVAITSFMHSGGDGVTAWTEGIALPPHGDAEPPLISQIVIDYIRAHAQKVRFQQLERRTVDLAAGDFDGAATTAPPGPELH
eukprot:a514189_8.p1 GENE.a514189_8~~a514189_8.p1  ORF type:complete len:590 (+),score=243.79 a514189_8:24-1772(+)